MANLTQLKMLEDLDAFLLVDKPAGIAFSTVVKTVKRKFNLVKVGHGGSLDAAASGLLVLLINDANKFVDRVMGADRAYSGTLRLGLVTNTHDIQGEPVAVAADKVAASHANLAAALAECRGDVFQTEPRFCAVRKEGSAGYSVAETGEHAPFLAHVYRFEVDDPAGPTAVVREDGTVTVPFRLLASKGVLVRTLVHDFGAALGCGACLETVRRTAVGKFSVDEAVAFDRLLETELGGFAALTVPLSRALV